MRLGSTGAGAHRRAHGMRLAALVLVAGVLVIAPAFAQEDETELFLRLNRAEEQVRQLTGMVEQLQHQNRLLQRQLQQAGVQGGAQPGGAGAPAAPSPSTPPNAQSSALPPPAPAQTIQGGPPPIVQNDPAPQTSQPRGDVFDPNANPDAPGAPRQLGALRGEVGAPGGREAGAPLDLSRPGAQPVPPAAPLAQPSAPLQQQQPASSATLATAPPSQTPQDMFDLGYGYLLRKDYALAEQTFDVFLKKYPSDRLAVEARYWLGESRFQRQSYRDAAEAFLAVSTEHGDAPRAPEALLRLGQSLVALGEKDAGCAALGEVARKYPRAGSQVKQGVAREQKRAGC